MKSWDAVIIGAGIIGVSLARALGKHGLKVLIVERGQPGREASHAAAGMLAHCDPALPEPLQPLTAASFAMYPEFVHEVEEESGERVDLRMEGTIAFLATPPPVPVPCRRPLEGAELMRLESKLSPGSGSAWMLAEGSVDPRALMAASLKAAKHRGIEVAFGSAVHDVEITGGRASAVLVEKTKYAAGAIINGAGAWASEVGGTQRFPVRPIKGQMLALVAGRPEPGPEATHLPLRHVVRAPDVYLVPRSDGRVIVGSTLEDVGYDKRVDPDTVQRLHQAAANLLPELGEARMLEAWAGLRPATPDHLPLLGPTSTPGYFAATGHYRDGILLAPITAHLMSQAVRGLAPDLELAQFSPQRFQS